MSRSKPSGKVVVFFTGGTITMRPLDQDRGVVPSEDFKRLFQELGPHFKEIGNIGLEPVIWSNLPSPHMTPGRMLRLAKDVDKALADPTVLGAVVVHGTDVLVESAFMADLVVGSPKPVVYTGSMRFYSETGYDGLRNLLNGIKACAVALPPEIGVVLLMNDRLFSARDVIKINSLNIDAFEAPESGPVAYVAGDTIRLTGRHDRGGGNGRPVFSVDRIENDVPLISCYTGMDGDMIDFQRNRGAKGLVIEAFGAGNVPPGAVPAIEAMIRAHIPVVLTTRCPEGGVWPIYAYPGGGADLIDKGVMSGGRLSGPKARLKLMVLLAMTRDVEEIRSHFNEDF